MPLFDQIGNPGAILFGFLVDGLIIFRDYPCLLSKGIAAVKGKSNEVLCF